MYRIEHENHLSCFLVALRVRIATESDARTQHVVHVNVHDRSFTHRHHD